MIREKIDFYLTKNRVGQFSRAVFIIGILFFVGIITYLSINNLHVGVLLKTHLTVFIFLLLTGYFLISFKYEILSIPISFNAFIIYMSYCILTEPESNDILLVILFIVVYFLSILIMYAVTKTLTVYKLEQFFIRAILWTILIVAFNFVLHFFKININIISMKTLVFIPVLIVIHAIIKVSFSLTERFFKKRYGALMQQMVTFIIIDSIFLFFSIILGTIYSQITMLHTAFFIAFLALIVSLTRYITRKYDELLRFYSVQAFITPSINKTNDHLPILPLFEVKPIDGFFDEKINYISFVLFFNVDKMEIKIPNNTNNSRFFRLDEHCLATILPTAEDSEKKIATVNRKQFNNNAKIIFCAVEKKFWDFIDVSLIFKVLAKFIKKFDPNSDVKRVDQSFIFHKE